MRLSHALLGSALMIAPLAAVGQPQSLGPIFQRPDGSVVLTECPPGGDHDEYCRAIVMKSRDGVTKLGAGYLHVTLLWSRRGQTPGPDALILGDYGGSGGDADLFVIKFASNTVRKLSGERFDTAAVRTGSGQLRVDIPFDIEFFNGAPHAGAIVLPLPLKWDEDKFVVDLDELTRTSYSPSELDFRALAIGAELHSWAETNYPSPRLYPPDALNGTPVAATGLVEMMLSGHADQARAILDRAWPTQWEHGDRPLGGKEDFWAALCQAVVREPAWKQYDLSRLPHADIVQSGAARPE